MADEKKEAVKPPECLKAHEPNPVTRNVIRMSEQGRKVHYVENLDALLIRIGLRKP